MPKVLFLCTLGFSALFADVPGLGFRVLHRLPPNNSTAWAKVGPSYRPSSCKRTTCWTHKGTASNGEVNRLMTSSKFPEVEEQRQPPRNNDLATQVALFSNYQDSLLGISSCPLQSWPHPCWVPVMCFHRAKFNLNKKNFPSQFQRLSSRITTVGKFIKMYFAN